MARPGRCRGGDETIARTPPTAAAAFPVPGLAPSAPPAAVSSPTDAEMSSKLQFVSTALGAEGTGRILHGAAGPAVCRYATDVRGDLVVHAHRDGLLKRVLLGSVSHNVVEHAPCMVLVVP